MNVPDIKRELEGVFFDELRADRADYFEAVVLRAELPKLTSGLEKIFGLPAWPSKAQLPAFVEQELQRFGGIRAGQTLYLLNDGDDTFFAMLWPWQDGWRTTLKITGRAHV
ncbi:MAG: hypothetical protein PHE18_06065 [Candidatus Omnitrophica bacterium]|nr:hypothetical protein [Candidatus Omnitrophota bacterium]MDD5553424.1 hypothetical protein [Candidatus Omnitrophota bacterium]